VHKVHWHCVPPAKCPHVTLISHQSFVPNPHHAIQELRALRFLHNKEAAWQSGLVRLLSGFTHCGHVCLVLERLHGSLLEYVVHSASLHRSEALHNLRKIATQLLVGHQTQLMSRAVTAHESVLLILAAWPRLFCQSFVIILAGVNTNIDCSCGITCSTIWWVSGCVGVLE